MFLRKVRPAVHKLVSQCPELCGVPDQDDGWVQLLELAQILGFKDDDEKYVLDRYYLLSAEALGNERGLVGVTVRHQHFTADGHPNDSQTVFARDSANKPQWWKSGMLYVPAGFSQRVLYASKHDAHNFVVASGIHIHCATNTIVCWKDHPQGHFDVVVVNIDCAPYKGKIYRMSREMRALLHAGAATARAATASRVCGND